MNELEGAGDIRQLLPPVLVARQGRDERFVKKRQSCQNLTKHYCPRARGRDEGELPVSGTSKLLPARARERRQGNFPKREVPLYCPRARGRDGSNYQRVGNLAYCPRARGTFTICGATNR